MAKQKYTDATIEKALRESKGMVYVASKALGCSHHTILDRIEKVPRLKDLVKTETEYVTDTAELKLFQAIINGESWAIQYRLTRKGKDRGYAERHEVTGGGGGPIQFMTVADAIKAAAQPEGEAH